MITVERLKELLNYDPETGVFTWKINKGRSLKGSEAGSVKHHGYRRIVLDGKRLYAHRLAWLITYGVWPSHSVDHINRQRDDNRIANLRDLPIQHNVWNQPEKRSNNTSGYPGVSALPTGRYIAHIRVDFKKRSLGTYSTAEEAAAAYLNAKKTDHFTCEF